MRNATALVLSLLLAASAFAAEGKWTARQVLAQGPRLGEGPSRGRFET